MNGIDKVAGLPISGYYGIELFALPDDVGGGKNTQTVEAPILQPSIVIGDVAIPVVVEAPQVAATSATTDTITAIGNVAATVIDAIKSNQSTVASPTRNTPTPTPDNGKKTSTVFWVVTGLVAATLLFFALKKSN
jgi:hypothetical protein